MDIKEKMIKFNSSIIISKLQKFAMIAANDKETKTLSILREINLARNA